MILELIVSSIITQSTIIQFNSTAKNSTHLCFSRLTQSTIIQFSSTTSCREYPKAVVMGVWKHEADDWNGGPVQEFVIRWEVLETLTKEKSLQ